MFLENQTYLDKKGYFSTKFRFMASKKYGLIGQSLSHSFSKDYFKRKFNKEQVDADYSNFEVAEISGLKNVLNQKMDGFNVTIPYKEHIVPFLKEIDDEALKIGAVNTLKPIPGGWKGFNTDVFGFSQSIKPFLKSHHSKALVLGTGGASKAVTFALEKIGVEVIKISRNTASGDATYDDINENMIKFCNLIVNTTPVGMSPKVEHSPKIPYQFITDRHLLYDLIYNPLETQFLKEGKIRGAEIMNGKSMLELQAEKSYEIWNQ